MNELILSVNGLKIGKASNPVGILAEMIESTLHEIAPILLSLYNRFLSTGQFPAAWSKSILCLFLNLVLSLIQIIFEEFL